MDPRGAEIIRLAQTQMRLPQKLRTEHWYNDWQHAVFIITFDHLMRALNSGHSAVAERLIDKLTVYLFVHFLCEEEGMAFSQQHGILAADKMRHHQALHLRFLDYWHDNIQRPFKARELSERHIAVKIQDFYEKVLQHIDDEDQTTYGTRTIRPTFLGAVEIANIALSGLPLSPNCTGAAAVVGACNEHSFKLLCRETLPIKAVEPLGRLVLTPDGVGADDSVRSRVLRATVPRSMRRVNLAA